jgi:hypothetical protein
MGKPQRPFPTFVVEEVGLTSYVALGNSVNFGESSFFHEDSI